MAEMMISGGCYQQSSCYSSRYKLDSLTGTSQIWKYRTFLFFVPIQILSGHMNLEPDDLKRKKKSLGISYLSCKSGKKAQLLVSVRCYLVFTSGVNF